MNGKRCALIGLLAVSASPLVDAFGLASFQPLQLRRSAAVATSVRMAGFGAPSGAKDSKAPTKITGIPKKTLMNYSKVVKEGAKPYKVFARVKGEDKWWEVGEVASKPDSPDAACTIHKRLALEYAVDVYPVLKPKAKMLELGYSTSGQSEDDISVVKKEENDGIAKDDHGFLPKEQGPKMGQGLYNINGDVIPVSGQTGPTFAPGGKKGTVNPLAQKVG